jgi:prevent-host-death family protein
MEVGIRELRNQLSRYLETVREGGEIVVTDHGRAIARLLPLEGPRAIDRLIAEGIVTPARQHRRKVTRRSRARGTMSDLVADQRR